MKRAIIFFILTTTIFLLAACGTKRPLDVIEQQVGENKLVPANAVQKTGLLDAYYHLLAEPENQPVALNLAANKTFISSEGDNIILQIGLASQKPKRTNKQFHYLLMRPTTETPALNRQLESLAKELSEIKTYVHKPTFDWSVSPLDKSALAPLLQHEEATSMDTFIRRYLIGLDSYNNKHFVIVTADHVGLGQKQQQNVADMAAYLAGKGASVSVVSLGEGPDAAFLLKVAEKGKGLFTLKTQSFQSEDWYKTEENYISANSITDVKIKVSLGKNIRYKRAITGETVNINDDIFTYRLKDFKQGEQRVSLFELTVPLMMLEAQQALASVELSIFDVASARYYADSKTQSVTYSNDLNQINASYNDRVNRSLTILNTADVITEASRLVQASRPYQAMNVISEQKESLSILGSRLNDDELQRDAEILGKYEKRLFDFAGESFQSLKAWKDLSWDKDRFTAAIE